MNNQLKPTGNDSSKNLIYILGAALGLAAGVVTAHLYKQAADTRPVGVKQAQIQAGDAFRIGLALMALVRQISALGSRQGK